MPIAKVNELVSKFCNATGTASVIAVFQKPLSVSLVFTSGVVRIFNSDPAVISAGSEYLKLVCFSFINRNGKCHCGFPETLIVE